MQSVTEVRGKEGEIAPTFEELFGSGDVDKSTFEDLFGKEDESLFEELFGSRDVDKSTFEDLFGKEDVKSSRLKCPLKNGKEFKLPSGNHTFTSSTLTSALTPSVQKRDRDHLGNPEEYPNSFQWLWKTFENS